MIRVNGKPHSWRKGITIADLLHELDDSYQYAVVRINDKPVSRPNFEKTLIPDDVDVFLLPLVAGG